MLQLLTSKQRLLEHQQRVPRSIGTSAAPRHVIEHVIQPLSTVFRNNQVKLWNEIHRMNRYCARVVFLAAKRLIKVIKSLSSFYLILVDLTKLLKRLVYPVPFDFVKTF